MKITKSIILYAFIVTYNCSFLFAQDLNGNYIDQSGYKVSVQDTRFIVTVSAYEFYGKPNTIYSFTYKLTQPDKDHFKLELIKSRIIAGPKRMFGAGSVKPQNRNPNYEGHYKMQVGENIEMFNTETSRKIVLKRIN